MTSVSTVVAVAVCTGVASGTTGFRGSFGDDADDDDVSTAATGFAFTFVGGDGFGGFGGVLAAAKTTTVNSEQLSFSNVHFNEKTVTTYYATAN